MFDVSLLIPDGIIWLLLACSVISIFINPKYWPYTLSITLTSAFLLERLTLIGVLAIVIGLGVAAFSKKLTGKWLVTAHCAVLVWAAALVLHLIPGFDNLQILDNVVTGPDSIPFTLYLNIDKPMVIFGLLLLVPTMLAPKMLGQPREITLLKLSVLVSLLVLLPALATMLTLVRPELSLPEWLWVFALNNLLFTCVAEEALFRGYIQKLLTQRFNHWIGITIASILFGLAHFAGGPLFILIAGCAGVLYGLTYYWTGRLSMAISVHFGFNLIHLIFFTYPLAASAS